MHVSRAFQRLVGGQAGNVAARPFNGLDLSLSERRSLRDNSSFWMVFRALKRPAK
ncbi:MAG: hypothetical protein ACI8T1_004722 [Verrucomicrobiales bacterium]|jgi:hypothetical protein